MIKFEYTWDHHKLINKALSQRHDPASTPTKIWKNPCVYSVKRELKSHRLLEQRGVCCYCQQYIHGQHKMTLDIEHILPKSIFKHCIFDLKNLAVSCRRCNFHKSDKLDFLNSDLRLIPKKDKSDLFKEIHYKFAHPNLTRVFDHLMISKAQEGGNTLIKYRLKTNVGKFTYEYFKLQDLEVNAIDEAQGIPAPESGFFYALVQEIEKDVYE